MNTFKLSISLLFMFLGMISQAQHSFEITYSSGRNDQARAIVQAYDSGYVVVGNTENYNGNTDVYLMKVDNKGTFLWAKRIGGAGNDGGEDLIQLADSGFAIVGYTHVNGSYDLFFIRTDKHGDTVFTKHFGGADWELGYSLQQTSDNGFILAGESHDRGNSKGYLVKLNSTGDSIWTKKFGGNSTDKFEDIIIGSNGDYIMAGETSSFGNGRQAYIVRTDTAGTVVWQNSYGNPGIDFAKSVVELSTGELVFAGGTNTTPFPDIDNWGVKLSAIGTLLQEHTIYDYSTYTPVDQNDDWNYFVITQQDSLIFGGKRSYEYADPGNIYLYRNTQTLDFTGYLSGFLKDMDKGEDIAHDAKVTYDKGVIYACTGEFMDTSASSIYLIKMDSTLTWPHPFFNSISFQNDVTSVTEKSNDLTISIYPNPSSSLVNIAIEGTNERMELRLFDLNGKMIESIFTKDSSTQIDVSQLNEGMYIIQIISENKTGTKKLIVTK